MSVERQKGKVTLICDDCGDEYEWYNPADFKQMTDDARDDDWYIVQEKGEWQHYCDHCMKHSPHLTVG